MKLITLFVAFCILMGCLAEVQASVEDINGSLWYTRDGSIDSDWYDREEVGFYGGKMYWRASSRMCSMRCLDLA